MLSQISNENPYSMFFVQNFCLRVKFLKKSEEKKKQHAVTAYITVHGAGYIFGVGYAPRGLGGVSHLYESWCSNGARHGFA